MKTRTMAVMSFLCVVALVCSLYGGTPAAKKEAAPTPVVHSSDADTMRIEGEQRFRANCGRCHAAPQKFPPRMIATVLRHMRVRATVTADDQHLILFYMTQ